MHTYTRISAFPRALGLFQKKIPMGGGGGGKKANNIFFYGWLVQTFFKLYGSLVFEKI